MRVSGERRIAWRNQGCSLPSCDPAECYFALRACWPFRAVVPVGEGLKRMQENNLRIFLNVLGLDLLRGLVGLLLQREVPHL